MAFWSSSASRRAPARNRRSRRWRSYGRAWRRRSGRAAARRSSGAGVGQAGVEAAARRVVGELLHLVGVDSARRRSAPGVSRRSSSSWSSCSCTSAPGLSGASAPGRGACASGGGPPRLPPVPPRDPPGPPVPLAARILRGSVGGNEARARASSTEHRVSVAPRDARIIARPKRRMHNPRCATAARAFTAHRIGPAAETIPCFVESPRRCSSSPASSRARRRRRASASRASSSRFRRAARSTSWPGRSPNRSARSSGARVIVDNKPGGNGAIAAETVARAARRRHDAVAHERGRRRDQPGALRQAALRRAARLRAGVARRQQRRAPGRQRRTIPANTVPEFIANAKKRAGPTPIASTGIGSIPHLAMEQLADASKANLLHVPYKGAAPGDHRRDGRAGGGVLRRHPGTDRAREGRQAQGDRHRRAEAPSGAARRADVRGAGHARASTRTTGMRCSCRRRRRPKPWRRSIARFATCSRRPR